MAKVTVLGSIAAIVLTAAALTTSTPAATAASQPQAGADGLANTDASTQAAAFVPIIDVITVNGSGCPAGTSSVSVSADDTRLTVGYRSFTAAAGAGTTPVDGRMNCQIAMTIRHPANVTYALTGAEHRGDAYLVAGATGTQRSNYYLQGMPVTPYVSHTFTGPMDHAWSTVDTFDPAALVWAPCGELRNLNLNVELRVSNGTASPGTTSWMAMSSTELDVYHLTWRSCG